jgi:aerobic-type carbon monoxide dehydrogenase small subunit (CoxS/CutS family)
VTDPEIEMTETFRLNLNGEERRFEAEPDKPLLWVLRDDLGIASAKYSCGIGICGSCLVWIDGQLVPSCRTPVGHAAGKAVTTLEGVGSTVAQAVKAAWIAEDVPQCGYCQSGQIVAAIALLSKTTDPTDDDIQSSMSRVLCRCGTYAAVRRAIRRASREVR